MGLNLASVPRQTDKKGSCWQDYDHGKKVTTKIGHQYLAKNKVHPADKILATPMRTLID